MKKMKNVKLTGDQAAKIILMSANESMADEDAEAFLHGVANVLHDGLNRYFPGAEGEQKIHDFLEEMVDEFDVMLEQLENELH